MAQYVASAEYQPANYRGLPGMFEFTNGDGISRPTNCGQAAACTMLTYMRLIQPDAENPHMIMKTIEAAHPPDNFGGKMGTSRRRVERILGAFGMDPTEIEGEENFRQMLDAGCPMIVMIGLYHNKLWKFTIPSGHWMVAYGYDDDLFISRIGAECRGPISAEVGTALSRESSRCEMWL